MIIFWLGCGFCHPCFCFCCFVCFLDNGPFVSFYCVLVVFPFPFGGLFFSSPHSFPRTAIYLVSTLIGGLLLSCLFFCLQVLFVLLLLLLFCWLFFFHSFLHLLFSYFNVLSILVFAVLVVFVMYCCCSCCHACLFLVVSSVVVSLVLLILLSFVAPCLMLLLFLPCFVLLRLLPLFSTCSYFSSPLIFVFCFVLSVLLLGNFYWFGLGSTIVIKSLTCTKMWCMSSLARKAICDCLLRCDRAFLRIDPFLAKNVKHWSLT